VESAWKIAILSLGGMLGVNARYWLGLWIVAWAGTRMPWATGLINVTGAFSLGLFLTLAPAWRIDPAWHLFFGVGFLGGYTTFSTFAVESVRLWNEAAFGRSIAYMAGSVILGVLAVALGMAIGRLLLRWS
jgi:CrcB protein